jgi:hypothetical protein
LLQPQKDAAAQEKAYHDALWEKLLAKKTADDLAAGAKSRIAQEAYNNASKYGIWETANDMNTKLQQLTVPQQRKAVEAQLKYHKYYLQTVTSDPKIFTLTVDKRKKSLQTLIHNLSALIRTANPVDEFSDDE